jgi:Lectin C-type domain
MKNESVIDYFQNTWAGAMQVCRSIGTDLLAVEYDDKDMCIAKMAKSNLEIYNRQFILIPPPPILLEKIAVHNLDYWTSGTQKDCPGKMVWCSLDRPVRNRKLNWATSHDGDCVSVTYGPNATYTKTACDKQLLFICEVNIICSAL